MTLILFLLGCASAWHGFQIGGTMGFVFLMGAPLCWLCAVASAAMNAPGPTSRRPPVHPPGYKNVKRRKK